MKIVIHGRNLEVSPAIREYTESKIERATHHFLDMIKEADVHLSVAKNPKVASQTAEVTIYANGTVIRAQEQSENLYASIDLVVNKLSRQLRKFKERHKDRHPRTETKKAHLQVSDEADDNTSLKESLLQGKEAHLPNPGIRRKYFTMNPISIEDAMHRLDLIDHDFYLFREQNSGEIQVIYKRNHGGYGVIQEKK